MTFWVYGLTLLSLCVALIYSCDVVNPNEEEEGNGENNDDPAEIMPQTSSRIVNRYPERYQNNVEAGTDIWIELSDSADLQGNIQAEIFEFSYVDSVWFSYSGLEGTGSQMNDVILQTNMESEGNKILFPIDPGRSSAGMFKPASILNGFKYLVHLYSDVDSLAIYWTFNTSPPARTFSFSDTLTVNPGEVNAAGKSVLIKLVDTHVEMDNSVRMGEITDPARYWAMGTLVEDPGPENCQNCERYIADFTIDGIEQGDYAIWTFIDMNDNAPNDDRALPDNGDYFKGVEEFGFYSNEKINEWKSLLNQLAWQPWP